MSSNGKVGDVTRLTVVAQDDVAPPGRRLAQIMRTLLRKWCYRCVWYEGLGMAEITPRHLAESLVRANTNGDVWWFGLTLPGRTKPGRWMTGASSDSQRLYDTAVAELEAVIRHVLALARDGKIGEVVQQQEEVSGGSPEPT